MATILTQTDGGGALNGGADDDLIVAQHFNGTGVPTPQILTGGAGDDVIFGDHDELFVDGELAGGNSNIIAASSIDGIQFWGQRENPDVLNSTSVPYTTVLATGDGSEDFFSVTVGDGETITIDIDHGFSSGGGGTIDTVVNLLDSSGTFVAGNDDGGNANGALGSSGVLNRDSFFTHTNTTGSTQVYVINVRDFDFGVIPIGGTYMMNVSVTNHIQSNFAAFGDDTINGNAGDDVLYGAEGDDTINGGADDDLIEGGSGADTMDGGAGIDTISYVSSQGGVSIDMLSGVGGNFGGGFGHGTGDTFSNVENVIGSEFGDFIAADSSVNVIDGRGGFDFVTYGADDAALNVDLETGVVASGGTDAAGDTLINIEAVTGTNDFGDTLRGSSANNVLNGQAGDDFLAGRGGADVLNGGAGRDTADYSESASGVQVNLDAGTATGGDAQGDTLNDIENVFGSQFSDTLTGTNEDNTLRGEGGNDTLNGGDGSDNLNGGDGDDQLNGDGGNDVLEGGNGVDVLNGGAGNDILRDSGPDQSDDTFNGGAGNDILEASRGTDIFDGGTGVDTYQIAGSDADFFNFTIDLGAGSDTFGNTYISIENVNGGAGNDTIIGTTGVNVIDGGDGDDTLSDNGGSDTLRGGAGDDTFIVRTGSNDFNSFALDYDGGTGNDTLKWTGAYARAHVWDMDTGAWLFGATVGRSVVNMEAFDASGMVGFGTDTFDIRGTSGDNIINGGVRDDTIEGRAGADTLDGGAGIDTLSYVSSDAGVVINLDAGIANGGHAAGDTFTNFENVTGSAFNDDLVGTGGDNLLSGGDGHDTLRGLGGRDAYVGGAGDDKFVVGNTASDVVPGESYLGGDGTDSLSLFSFGTGAEREYDLRGNTFQSVEQILFQTGNLGSGDLSAKIDVSQANEAGLTTLGIENRNGTDTFNLEMFMGAETALDLSGFTFLNGYGSVVGDRITVIGDGDAEGVFGSSIRDVVDLGGGNDRFSASLGADQVALGGGNDRLQIDDGFTGFTTGTVVDGGTGFDKVDVVGGGTLDLRNGTLLNMEGIEFDARNSGEERTVQITDAQALSLDEIDGNVNTGSQDILQIDINSAGDVDLSGLSFVDWTPNGADQQDLVIIRDENTAAQTITGTSQNDLFLDDSGLGNGSVDVLKGGAGNDTFRQNNNAFVDTIEGGTGVDTVDLSLLGGIPVSVSLVFGVIEYGLSVSAITEVENIIGTAQGDALTGDAGSNVIDGGDGDDIIEGGAGADVLDGGAGIDTLSFAGASAGVNAELRTGTGLTGDAAGDSFVNFENILGSEFNDFFAGDNQANFIDGGAGTDRVSYFFDDAAVTLSLEAGFVLSGGSNASGDTFANIENISGTNAFGDDLSGDAGDNTLIGDGGDDVLEGKVGADILNGGSGSDTARYSSSDVGVFVDLLNGTSSGGHAEGDTFISIENVMGSDFADTIVGDGNDNFLIGLDGDDVFILSGGSDQVLGGDGNDVVFDNGIADPLASDFLSGGDGYDTLVLNLIQWGPDMKIDLLSQVQTIGGGATIVDTITGFEEVIVNGRAEIRGDDNDNVLRGVTGPGAGGPGSFANILSGEGGDDQIYAGDDNDVLSGGFGNDMLFGEAGDDLLSGGLGDDLLDGGTGIDTVTYADAGGRVAVFLGRAPADVGSGQGIDTFVSIENVIGTDFDDRLVGNNAENTLVGGLGNDVLIGLGGADLLDGGAGNDELTGSGGDDTLLGGAGNDQMFGLGGADTFDGGAGNDLIEGGLGVDTIDGGIGDDDIFGFFGVDTINGGNGFDNIRADGSGDIVNGGGGNDRIVGGNGKDILWGGSGNDTLFGGGGNGNGDGLRDTFVFKSAANGGGGFDIIRDFEDTLDKIDLSESGYTEFADVFADAAQVGANVEINFDFSGILRIENFDLVDLTAGDFIF